MVKSSHAKKPISRKVKSVHKTSHRPPHATPNKKRSLSLAIKLVLLALAVFIAGSIYQLFSTGTGPLTYFTGSPEIMMVATGQPTQVALPKCENRTNRLACRGLTGCTWNEAETRKVTIRGTCRTIAANPSACNAACSQGPGTGPGTSACRSCQASNSAREICQPDRVEEREISPEQCSGTPTTKVCGNGARVLVNSACPVVATTNNDPCASACGPGQQGSAACRSCAESNPTSAIAAPTINNMTSTPNPAGSTPTPATSQSPTLSPLVPGSANCISTCISRGTPASTCGSLCAAPPPPVDPCIAACTEGPGTGKGTQACNACAIANPSSASGVSSANLTACCTRDTSDTSCINPHTKRNNGIKYVRTVAGNHCGRGNFRCSNYFEPTRYHQVGAFVCTSAGVGGGGVEGTSLTKTANEACVDNYGYASVKGYVGECGTNTSLVGYTYATYCKRDVTSVVKTDRNGTTYTTEKCGIFDKSIVTKISCCVDVAAHQATQKITCDSQKLNIKIKNPSTNNIDTYELSTKTLNGNAGLKCVARDSDCLVRDAIPLLYNNTSYPGIYTEMTNNGTANIAAFAYTNPATNNTTHANGEITCSYYNNGFVTGSCCK